MPLMHLVICKNKNEPLIPWNNVLKFLYINSYIIIIIINNISYLYNYHIVIRVDVNIFNGQHHIIKI
jgi:hypothetical protein